MTPLGALFVVVNAIVLLLVRRRWAPLPLLTTACYMTLGQGVEIGSFSFTAIRLIVLAGVLRVVIRRERLSGGLSRLDWVMVAWAAWACASAAFHEPGALTFRLGLVYNACGVYFLLRIFCTSLEDVMLLCRMTAVLLIPVAALMAFEQFALYNVFSIFGGVTAAPMIRGDRVRARGPFAHPILAGTVGAVCLPLMAAIWRTNRTTASVGGLACVSIVVSSASSGPLMSAIFAVIGLFMWSLRDYMRKVRWGAVLSYVALDLVMNAPAYYLISRIDLAGGSTGFHRARLIESSIEHLGEWWFAGTDRTRHWMPTGVSWSGNHTDITNHYLYMGVLGGLPLVLLFVAGIAIAFHYAGSAGRESEAAGDRARRFVHWAIGASLFAHATTSISVSYFDQSFLFLYLSLAAIASARLAPATSQAVAVSASSRPRTAGGRAALVPGGAARELWPRRTASHHRLSMNTPVRRRFDAPDRPFPAGEPGTISS